MSKDAESIQVGTCPICRAPMIEKDGFVICPNSDYKAEYIKWDEVWNAFDAKSGDGEKLVSDLIGLNGV